MIVVMNRTAPDSYRSTALMSHEQLRFSQVDVEVVIICRFYGQKMTYPRVNFARSPAFLQTGTTALSPRFP